MDGTERDVVHAPKESIDVVPVAGLVEQTDKPATFTQSTEVQLKDCLFILTYKCYILTYCSFYLQLCFTSVGHGL